MINNKLKFLSLAFFMNACATNANFSPEHSFTVEYMQTGNAASDAQVAIQNKNFTLIGFDQRGLVIPGINGQMFDLVIKNCNVTRINNMGDVVKDKNHLKQMQNVRRYSEQYNLEIIKVAPCSQQK